MKANPIKETVISQKEGVPFLASSLYEDSLSSFCSEAAFYKAIGRLEKSGLIKKAAKGLYYRPLSSRFGELPFDEEKAILPYYEGNKGMEIGYALYRKIGLSTQVAKERFFYTNSLKKATKTIGSSKLRYINLVFDEKNKDAVMVLEVLHNLEKIQDLNEEGLRSFLDAYCRRLDEKAIDKAIQAIGYPKWCIAFLKAVLDEKGIPNTLGRHLSPFSKYRYPMKIYMSMKKSSGSRASWRLTSSISRSKR